MAISRVLVIAAAVSIAGCDFGHRALDAREDIEETFPFEPGSEFRLENVNGSVDVETWDRQEIRIEAKKRAFSERRLRDIDVEIDETSDGVEVKTRFRKKFRFWGGGRVDYRVRLPARARVEVSTVNGKLEIRGIEGRLEASSINGSVEIEQVSGAVDASTVNGSITASYEAVDEDGRNRFSTTNGSVRLSLPPDASAELEARTVNGRIRSEFDELETSGRRRRRRLSGQIGDGGGRFEIKTVNGSVRIGQS